MIEYELIQQQVRELHAQADHQRLVREAKVGQGLRRLVTTRADRRAARLNEC
ncbi:hypothetical protein J5Y04_09295 [Kitasatospora sp. RG8]|uniref:hypothetical protein n=1 Tax=Kitasatospora sp. RG8 TaxID=2820815 RepID=UPI001ADEEEA5|nr:hypothetical protein [Kitasatospora sp. RG8]MBP0449746.1 hypothetical protein [Kitasatospora sp. RG8]